MLDPEALALMMADVITEQVEKAVAPLHARIAELEAREPVAGPPGEKGDPGEPGKNGVDGIAGKDGSDGRGVKDLLIDREGQLVATMDDGEMKTLGHIIGKDGEPGKDGRDGFSLDDFDCQPIDERTIKMTFVRGEVAHSYELQFPVVVYRGVYREGEEYERGDTVTWGGSLWHCDTPTKDKPGTESWTLAAKKGRDGKDGKNG